MVINEWAVAVTLSVTALSAGAVFVLRGPVGKALGRWIESWSTPEHKAMEAQVATAYAPGGGSAAEVGKLRAEVAELRQQIADADDLHRQLEEVQERLDFTERLLTKPRESARLGPGGRS